MAFINWGSESQEQKEIRRRMEEQAMFEQAVYRASLAAMAAVGGGGQPTPLPASGDLTLVFSNFDTVDLILAGGFDSLPDWNAALVDGGTPYTSIIVDEPNFTIYLSGGSGITLTSNAFNGIVEAPTGLGDDLVSIVDTGSIIATADHTFSYCDLLQTCILPAVTTLGDSDFEGCTLLNELLLPMVTDVGYSCFYGAFNTATSPITFDLPSCTTFGSIPFTSDNGEETYGGTTEVDSPKVLTATFASAVSANPDIVLFIAQNTGVVPVYV
jgi:hypothetical protein